MGDKKISKTKFRLQVIEHRNGNDGNNEEIITELNWESESQWGPWPVDRKSPGSVVSTTLTSLNTILGCIIVILRFSDIWRSLGKFF